jgi:hypothetical protein
LACFMLSRGVNPCPINIPEEPAKAGLFHSQRRVHHGI